MMDPQFQIIEVVETKNYRHKTQAVENHIFSLPASNPLPDVDAMLGQVCFAYK